MKLFLSTNSTNEHYEKPAYAVIEATPAFLDEIGRLQAVVKASKLAEARIDVNFPLEWEGDRDDDRSFPIKIAGARLCVNEWGQWYIDAYDEWGDDGVNTDWMSIEELIDVVHKAQAEGREWISCNLESDELEELGLIDKEGRLIAPDDNETDIAGTAVSGASA